MMLKNYPYIKQDETKDCGVACLQMIFKYYKGYVSKMKLLELTKTSKNGTTAYHMIETLKVYGFNAKGFKIDDISKVKLPCIAFVTINKTYTHYVVIYEVNKNYLVIGDPATRLKKISIKEFKDIFNGIVIFMSPTKKLPEYVQDNSKFHFCLSIVKIYKKLLVRVILFSLFITIFSIINSFYLQYMVDNINENKNYLLLIFIIFILLYLMNLITEYFRNKLLNIINKNIDNDITMITFKQIIFLPYRYYSNRNTGDIISRISDLEEVRTMISKIALTLFIDTILVFISFFVLYFISSKLFFISLITLLLYIILLILFRPFIKNGVMNCQQEKANVTSYMVESISSYETIKGLNLEDKTVTKLHNKYLKLLNNIFKIQNIYNLESFIKNLINDLCFLIIIYLGVLEVTNNNLSIGKLLTFNSLLIYFLGPIKNIIDLDNNITSAKSALNRILELFFNEKESGIINKRLKGNIEIKNLDFSYNDRDYILNNVNLEIKEGEKVLFLGNSGCGKSTILKLLKKYYKIERNKILINDIDINDYKQQSINDSITYVSQNELLYTDTLYNNIILDRKINNSRLEQIIDICQINFLDNNLGYNMLIEENGFNLSGGQRQRIILARSLVKNFDILLLDEATSEIDGNLERVILKKLFAIHPQKTIVIVSHRKENIDLFDKVIKIGKNVEGITRND